MAEDVGVKLTADGEQTFRSALAASNAQIKELQASLRLSAAEMSRTGSEQDKLRARNQGLAQQMDAARGKVEILTKQYERQKAKLSELEAAMQKAVQEHGADSEAAIKATNAYNSQAAEVARLGTQLNRASADLAEMSNEVKQNEESLKKMGIAAKAAAAAANVGEKLKQAFTVAAKAAAAAAATAGAAVVAVAKMSLDGYSQQEQLIGGVKTLFGTEASSVGEYAASVGKSVQQVQSEYDALTSAQNTVLSNANNAYKNAGLSANEYMETVTSFSASLIQSVGGDTVKAAQLADQAIVDMSDNANKMGTDMASIQNAYQGFAKQNYTMLDNLKLGYGGTKEEMQRLLKDAQKISGIKYDISSFADVTEAIHVVQQEMGITGTTAAEASKTIEGSTNAAKAAWSNLVTGIADENADLDLLVGNFVDAAATAGQNIIPRITQILSGMGTAIAKLAPKIAQQVPALISTVVPSFITAGAQMLTGLIQGVSATLPALLTSIHDGLAQLPEQLATAGTDIMTALSGALSACAPQLLTMGTELLDNLISGVTSGLQLLFETGPQIVEGLLSGISTLLPSIASKGTEMINNLVNGLLAALPSLLASLPQIISSFVSFIASSLPTILQSGMSILMNLLQGIVQTIPQLIAQVPVIIRSITSTLSANLPQIVQTGFETVVNFIGGLLSAIPDLIASIPQIVGALLDGLGAAIGGVFEIGGSIVSGLADGIASFLGLADDAGTQAADSVAASVEALPASMNATGTQAVQELGSGMTAAAPALSASAASLLDGINLQTQGIGTTMSADGASAVTNMAAGMTGAAGQVAAAAGGISDSAVAAMATMPAEMQQATIEAMTAMQEAFDTFAVGVEQTMTVRVPAALQVASGAFTTMQQAISQQMTQIDATIRNGLNAAIAFLTALPAMAVQWGADFAAGYANGIRSNSHLAAEAAKAMADQVAAYTHFSRPDKGPLRDYESWPRHFLEGYAAQLEANAWRVERAAANVAAAAAFEPAANTNLAQDAPAGARGRAGATTVVLEQHLHFEVNEVKSYADTARATRVAGKQILAQYAAGGAMA